MMRKSVAIGIVLLTLAGHGACTQKTARQDMVYKMPLPDRIQTLNPREARFVTDDQLMKAVFGQLLGVDRDGYIEPKVCYKWDISPDLLEYVFYIRDDLYFHDGVKLTAKDIVFSFEYAGKNPTLLKKAFLPIQGYQDYYDGKVSSIGGIQILDDYTFKIKLNRPATTFLYILANSRLIVLPDDFHGVSDAVFFQQPIGVGPYKFEYWRESEFSIVKNEGSPFIRGNVDRFVFMTMSKEEAVRAFEDHKVEDLHFFVVLPEEVKRTDINIKKWSTYATHFLFLNVKRKPLDNVNVRLAIRAAIDRKVLVEKCSPEGAVSSGVIPFGIVGAIDDAHAFDGLNDSVDHYLQKAGVLRTQLPRMTIIRFTEMYDECFKTTIEEMFKKNRLPITVEYVSFADGVRKVENNDYYILSEGLTARNIEAISILNFFDGRSTHNLSNMNDQEVNSLIDLAELAKTRGARGEVYRKISRIILEKAYAVDMQYLYKYYISDKKVQEVENPGLVRFFTGLAAFSFTDGGT